MVVGRNDIERGAALLSWPVSVTVYNTQEVRSMFPTLDFLYDADTLL